MKTIFCVQCKGNCIKPNEDIIEHYFKRKFKCFTFINFCKRKLHGYKCEAEVSKIESSGLGLLG